MCPPNPVWAIMGLTGAEPLTAMRAVTAAVAAVWCSVLFLLLRVLLGRKLEAVLLTLLGAVSGAAVFWFAVPESYCLGSLSIVNGEPNCRRRVGDASIEATAIRFCCRAGGR